LGFEEEEDEDEEEVNDGRFCVSNCNVQDVVYMLDGAFFTKTTERIPRAA
jgi:hypothetical protein